MSTGNLDFEQFRVFLEKACGILLGENKQYLVSSRLNKLMEQQGIKSLGELVQRIQSQPRGGLREQVVDAMTTNETCGSATPTPSRCSRTRSSRSSSRTTPGSACASGRRLLLGAGAVLDLHGHR